MTIPMFRAIFHLIHNFAPKWNHAVIWGWPDGEDSVIALEQALQETTLSKVILLQSCPHGKMTWITGPKTIRVRKNSLTGIISFLLARYVFFTHPFFTRNFPPNVIAVNVWHGMPIKRIGWMIENDPGTRCRYTLATSPFWATIMEQAMRPGGSILNTGLPRNDRLSCDRDSVFAKLGLSPGMRLGAWLPTYRKSARGLTRNDGSTNGNVFEMSDLDPVELNQLLKEHHTALIVKPHPMSDYAPHGPYSNLYIVDGEWLLEHHVSLYELLGATDFLISDVSSVVIDYLLVDRPVVHAFSDREAYEKSRGFTVESLEQLLAGPVAANSCELFSELKQILNGDDPSAEKRHQLRTLCYSHVDYAATERLLATIGLR